MSEFKGRHFEGEIVLWAVRWYCRYGASYRDLEQMMGERVTSVKLVEIRGCREVAIGQAARGAIWMGSAVSIAASSAMPSTCM